LLSFAEFAAKLHINRPATKQFAPVFNMVFEIFFLFLHIISTFHQ